MPISSVLSFCESHKTPVTAIKCNPSYDEKKGRVTKGATKAHTGWKEKRFQKEKTTATPFDDMIKPTMWMMYLKPQKLLVIDIDVRNGKTAKDVMTDEMYNVLYNQSNYIVQTGSGGLHFYFKLPEDFKGRIQDYINITPGEGFFKEEEDASVDIIMDSIITEGSEYTYEGETYKYVALKDTTIKDVTVWEEFNSFYNQCLTPKTEKKTVVSGGSGEVNRDEIKKHLNNIPNTTNNWDDWYRMGQTLFNVFGSDGYELFRDWSAKASCFDERATYNLWKGLKIITDDPRTVGSIYYLSKQSNEEEYYKIKNEFSDAFWNFVKNPTHYEASAYFYKMKPYAYLHKTDQGWYSLLSNKTWQYSDKRPSMLINDIAHTFKVIVNQKKNEVQLGTDEAVQKERMKQLMKLGTISGQLSFCEAVANFLRGFYNDDVLYDKMDSNKHLFAFLDKVYDLDKGEVREIEPTDYISITTGYNMPTKRNPKVEREILKFFYDCFEDHSMVQFELDKMSYALHGDKKLEKFVIETGDGRNGKGTKSKLIQSALGSYYVSIPIATFTKPSDRKDAPNPALVKCRGKRYIEASEPEKGDKLYTGLIKEMTGGDVLSCRGMFGKTLIEFVVQGLLNFQANGVPKYNKIDQAINDRNIIEPFPFHYVGSEELKVKENDRIGDCNLKSKVSSVEWRNEYIMILLDNYKVFKTLNELKIPKAIKERTEENLEDNVPIKDWVEANVEKGLKTDILSSELYNYYKDTQTGQYPVSVIDFAIQMSALGFEKKRKTAGNFWKGAGIKTLIVTPPAQKSWEN